MDTFLALAPYLLILLCPAVMFFGMRCMMKGIHGEQSGMNMAPPHNEMSDARMGEEVARLKAENEQLRQQPRVGEGIRQ